VAIELANQYKADGNFTKAEVTLSNAIKNKGTVELYAALCKTYVQQDKLMDAVAMLENISDPAMKEALEKLRPTAPEASHEPGFYSQYIELELASSSGTLYYTTNGEYPSISGSVYSEPLELEAGETVIYAISVDGNGLVSEPVVSGYTIGGVIEPADFADKAVEMAVREVLGARESEILYTNVLWDITEFTVPANAASLADLKLMPYLKSLTIQDQNLGTLVDLSHLDKLESLDLTGSTFPAAELKVLAELPSLTSLTLSNCGISTIAALEGAEKLTYLDLSNNTIRNIQALSAMTGLQEAHLQHNALTDLSSLSSLGALTKLDISYNAVTSLAPLLGLSGLTWLDSSYNNLTTLDPLDPLSSLTYLSLSNNNLSDVSVLAACTSLTQLDVSSNILTDIISLDTLVNLTYFSFAKNQVTEIPTFSEDCMLITIDGSNNLLTSLEPLNGLKNLNNIYMDYNEEIDSVECLKDCPKLIVVNVYGTAVTEVEMLTDQSIIVNFNPVQDGE